MDPLGLGRARSRLEPGDRRARLERVLCVLATILALAPFTNKPLHIDDPLFVWAAQRILVAPFDFYGFPVNWYGVAQPMYDVMKNPPLISYWHAATVAVAGGSEPALHWGAMPWAVAAILGAYELARRFSRSPLLAGVTTLTAPAFLVSATSLGSDVPMLAAWLWAIALWVRGLDRGGQRWLVASAALCTVAALMKYFAVGLIPLLLVYTLARERRVSFRSAWLLVPVSSVFFFERATSMLYGQGLFLAAAGYAASVPVEAAGGAAPGLLERGGIGLLFVGGAVVSGALLGLLVWSRRALLLACGIALLGALAAGEHGALGALPLRTAQGVDWLALAHVASFALLGIAVVALGVRDFVLGRDADALLLFCAFAGTIAFGLVFNWTTNARSLISLAPIVAILIARALEREGMEGLRTDRFRLGLALLVGAGIGLAVTWADWRLAWTFREAARVLGPASVRGTPSTHFLGHWGFQYYLEKDGARALDLGEDRLAAGDILIVPENSPGRNDVPQGVGDVVARREVEPSGVISLQSLDTRTGFHAAVRGPLPFALGRVATERFVSLRLRRSVEVRRGGFRPSLDGRDPQTAAPPAAEGHRE